MAEAIGIAQPTRVSPVAVLGFTLFFLLLFVPSTYQGPKALLMLVLVVSVVVAAVVDKRVRLHRAVLGWTYLCLTASVIFMLRGLLAGAPGAMRVGTVYVVWPVVYIIFAAGVTKMSMLRGLMRTLVVAAIAISLYAVTFVLHAIGRWPSWLYLRLDQGQAIGLHSGFVEINLYSLASLLFIVPFVFACLVSWPVHARAPAGRLWLWLALLSTTIVVLLSGRRALLLTTAIGIPLTLGLRMLLPLSDRRATRDQLIRNGLLLGLAVSLFVVYLGTLGLTIDGMKAMFLEGFDFSGDLGAWLRKRQAEALVAGWLDSPVIGAGHGAAAPEFVRDANMPWSYELSYIALLFHVGVIGMAIYGGAVLWTTWMVLRIIRRGGEYARYALPMLVGSTYFLIGNATNPYLEKFDYLWVLFLPVALVNSWLVQRDMSDAWPGRCEDEVQPGVAAGRPSMR